MTKKHYRLDTSNTPFETPNRFPPPVSEYPVTAALKDQDPKDHCIDCKVEVTDENRNGENGMMCNECWNDLPF